MIASVACTVMSVIFKVTERLSGIRELFIMGRYVCAQNSFNVELNECLFDQLFV